MRRRDEYWFPVAGYWKLVTGNLKQCLKTFIY